MKKFITLGALIFFALPLSVFALDGMSQNLGGTTFYNFTDGTVGTSQNLGGSTYYNFITPTTGNISDGCGGYPVGGECKTQSDYEAKKATLPSEPTRAGESGSFTVDYSAVKATLDKCQQEVNDYQKKLAEYNTCEKNLYTSQTNTNANQTASTLNTDSACSAKFGIGTYYNLTEKSCYCSSGYQFDKATSRCITNTLGCQNTYGVNAYAKIVTDGYACYCTSGYVLNSKKTQCITGVDFCKSYNTPTVSYTYNSLLAKCEAQNANNSSTKLLQVEEQKTIQKNLIDEVKTREKTNLTKIDKNLSKKLSGKILLQIENKGEAWFVNPKDKKKYYMANGEEAFKIMRDLGTGITNKDFEKITKNKKTALKYSGKIYLKVEDAGQAYYIDFDGTAHYLKNGDEAFAIMRDLGVGITNINLRKLDVAE